MGWVEKVFVRRMTAAEFDSWLAQIAEGYAEEQVAAGRWPSQGLSLIHI